MDFTGSRTRVLLVVGRYSTHSAMFVWGSQLTLHVFSWNLQQSCFAAILSTPWLRIHPPVWPTRSGESGLYWRPLTRGHRARDVDMEWFVQVKTAWSSVDDSRIVFWFVGRNPPPPPSLPYPISCLPYSPLFTCRGHRKFMKYDCSHKWVQKIPKYNFKFDKTSLKYFNCLKSSSENSPHIFQSKTEISNNIYPLLRRPVI